ncbi:MAG: VOC family protein [Acidimicrobiales bacterium]
MSIEREERQMAGIAVVGSVVIDVTDYDTQKTFWQAVLGVEVAREFPGAFCWFAPQHDGAVSVALQHSPEPGADHGRVHIDTGVADLDQAQAAIEALGGSHVEDHEVMGFEWRIMADPEGNRFCIAKE